MTWLLLVIFHYWPPTTVAMRFPNQESCQAALDWYKSQANQLKIDAVCLEDVKKP